MNSIKNIQSCGLQGDLTNTQRYARAAAALIMLGYPMVTAAAPLGIVAILPLLAIYPMFTAVVGWDPVRYVLNDSRQTLGVNQTVARTGLVVVGTGLIAATMLTTVNPIGGIAILALLGILPIFVAIFGENPFSALAQSCRNYEYGNDEENLVNPVQTQVSENLRVVEYTPKESAKTVKHDHLPEHHEAA